MSLRRDRRVAVTVVAVAAGILALAGGCAAPQRAPDPAPGRLDIWAMPHCVGQQPAEHGAAEHRPAEQGAAEHRLAVEAAPVAGAGPVVRAGPAGRQDGPAGAGAATAYVERYEHGWGPRAVAEIRTVLRVCGSYEYGGSGDPAAYREQHLIAANGFAADESLLVETVRLSPPEPPRTWCTTVVRSGDVVATVRVAQPDPAPPECAVATDAAPLATGAAGQA